MSTGSSRMLLCPPSDRICAQLRCVPSALLCTALASVEQCSFLAERPPSSGVLESGFPACKSCLRLELPAAFALSGARGRSSSRGRWGPGSRHRHHHPRGLSGALPRAPQEPLSEYVQKGFQMLADPGSFDSNTFTLLLRAAFQSLLDAQADEAVLDHPDLKHIDPVVLKHCHAAAATYILEAGKQRADRSTLSTYLEDCKFDSERIELFWTEYQNNRNSLEILLGSIGRSLPHITDVSWRLEYQIKTNQLDKMYRPAYLVTLNVENTDSRSHPEISFSCNMEQLQDLVGKLKDASKSLERATQL
ncbi:PREDICTED: COMM domain-containing protein 3 [Bison bison bison]|uniref:COMM domain-containing protein 3 n=1 Tax=Bison bison bison TaxID=43346 RepID=A0A6P3IVJ6_BISBB|nr:PREDICTED: COMM domain-containing protein 3 [Bison bison bison]